MSEPKWLTVARDYLGQKEIAGSRHNATIVGFFERVTGRTHPDETAWCAAFVGNCLLEAGERSTGALNARSYMQWGRKLSTPVIGCVVVFWRGKKSGWQGHVGFYIGEDGDKILVLGGNQSNKVSIARYPKSRLLGYRWPAGEAAPSAPAAKSDVKAVQASLRALGYSEVGKIDGIVGSMTRGAVLAFKADWNEANPDKALPLDATMDDAFLAALMVAAPRVVSIERETATLEDLRRAGSRTVAATDVVKGVGGVVGIGGAIGGVAEGTGFLDKVKGAGEAAQTLHDALAPIRNLLAFAGDHWWVLAAGIGGTAVWFAARAAWARLDDHRQARTV